MKRVLLSAAIVAMAIVSYAQKVDLDKFSFNFEYRDLPRSPLAPEFKTYTIKVNAGSSIRNNYSDSGIEDAVKIEGLKKISGGPAHVIVSVTLDDLIIASSNVTERVEVRKDKDGKETGRTYYYKVEAAYSWDGRASVKDHKENALTSVNIGTGSKTWTSSEYGTRKEAADYYNNNREEIKGKLIRDEVNTGLSALTSSLSTSFGYTPRKEYEILWILDSKKHPETAVQKENWETFKAAVTSITPNELPEATKEKFVGIIKYFDSVITKFPADEKADKKLRYAAYYNKAKIYLYLDNPEAAIKEAEALIANAYDEGDGKRLKKEAETLIELFKKNNATSRHFAIDLSNVQGPAAN